MTKKLLSIALICSVFFLTGCKKDVESETMEPETTEPAVEVRSSVPTSVEVVAPDDTEADAAADAE